MAIKKLMTTQPVRYKTDKKGNKIAVFRGGTVDGNKYAKLTPQEKNMKDQIGKKDYKPLPNGAAAKSAIKALEDQAND